MRFSNVLYFVISINIVLFLASSVGIWHPAGSPPIGHDIGTLISAVLGFIGYASFAGLVGFIGASYVGSSLFSTEKVAGYALLGGLYGGVTSLTTNLFSSINVTIGGVSLSVIFGVIFFMIFLVFIIQTIFGGFKTYE